MYREEAALGCALRWVKEMAENTSDARLMRGLVKWFDPSKGFGFVVADDGGPDILLHANVLRNFGQSSVADGSAIELSVLDTERGIQAAEIITITPPEMDLDHKTPHDDGFEDADLTGVALEPARVKWFDKSKGFGFANVFRVSDDIFIHVEVLRRSGLADLQPGEAIGVRVVDGKRGRMAAQVASWEVALKEE